MFAFAIWDNQRRILFCARDRAGEKPFYYSDSGGSFRFASELKALLLSSDSRRIHYPALIDYLSFGYVPEPKTIWEHCRKLEPGHSMTVEFPPDSPPRARVPVQYWDFTFHPDHSERDWNARILETLKSSASEMSFADVPLGAFLSGGVDSSSVTASLSQAGCAVNTFTVGFEEQGFDERPWAAEVARLYRTRHTERLVRADDVEPVFEKMLWHYDEPFNDYSYFPTYYLCREARRSITVALSGDGGDELFAGYRKYQRLAFRQNLDRFVPALAAPVMAGALASAAAPHKLAHYAAPPESVFTDMLTTAFSLPELSGTARGPLAAALREYCPGDTVRRLLARAPVEETGLVNAMRYLDLKLTLCGDMLVKVDRASMAVALEVRPVYLHRDMLDLAARIPSNLLVTRKHSKKLLKSALRAWLPDSILNRPKMGFALPLERWITRDLKPLFDGGGSAAFDELIDPALPGRLLAAHESGRPNLALRIHNLFFLKHWLNKWT
jgi:asparagine synthase (glutamine-hydrolysing)